MKWISLLFSFVFWLNMAQFARPTSDISKGSDPPGQCLGNNDSSAFDELDESVAASDDATTSWWLGAGSGEAATKIECGLNSVTDPAVATGHIIRLRCARNTAATTANCQSLASSGQQNDVTFQLKEGATVRATGTITPAGLAWETLTYTLSAGEANSITNYATLRLEVYKTETGGGAGKTVCVSAMEFECPDAVSGQQITVVVPVETDVSQALHLALKRVANQVTETDVSQALTRRRSYNIAQNTETNVSQVLTRRRSYNIVQTAELDAAQVFTRKNAYTLALLSELDEAPVITLAAQAILVNLVQSSEIDVGQVLGTPIHLKAIAQILETDESQSLGRLHARNLSLLTEADLSQVLTPLKARNLIQSLETSEAIVMGRLKLRALTQLTEINIAQVLASLKVLAISQIAELDESPAIVNASVKTVILSITSETDESFAAKWAPMHRLVNQVTELDDPQTLGRMKAKTVGITTETDVSQILAQLKSAALARALETDGPEALSRLKSRVLNISEETDLSLVIDVFKQAGAQNIILIIANELDEAGAWTSWKLKDIIQAVEHDEVLQAYPVGGLPPEGFGAIRRRHQFYYGHKGRMGI